MRSLRSLFYILILFALAASCAKPVAPTGGAKDEKPPELVGSVPENGSVNFSGREILIEFDEFIDLKKVNENLLISPPPESNPDVKHKRRKLEVKFKEDLRPNTTYSLFFGDAIADLNEGNVLPGYTFTFSTGPQIDSLKATGIITNAFTLEPVKNASIMLYENADDSVPYRERPYYVAKSNAEGMFTFTSLRAGKYRIFGLVDGNSNYLYDLPSEEIAFLNEEISIPIDQQTVPITDTTVVADTVRQTKIANLIRLRSFVEADTAQRLLRAAAVRPNVINYVFRYPVQSPAFTLITPDAHENWYFERISPGRDTITHWIYGFKNDTMTIAVKARGMAGDTLRLALSPPPSVRPVKTPLPDKLFRFQANIRSQKLEPGNELVLRAADPLIKHDFLAVRLFEDSVRVEPEVSFTDSLKTHIGVKYAWKEKSNYQLLVRENTFLSLFGDVNDSVNLKFTPFAANETSSIRLKILSPGYTGRFIVYLMQDKNTIATRIIGNGETADFPHLRPQGYRIKVVFDRNGNGRWDTGNYLTKTDAEQAVFYPQALELRANWNIDDEWTVPLPE